jgi:hypothetical protein
MKLFIEHCDTVKLFELLVYRFMHEDLRGYFAGWEHGFVKGRSTVSNLFEYGFDLHGFFKCNRYSVSYCLLLDKMSSALKPARCQWLHSNFSGGIQCIRIMGDCVSRDILVILGVSHGSHLEPLCFILFVNEVAQIFEYVQVTGVSGHVWSSSIYGPMHFVDIACLMLFFDVLFGRVGSPSLLSLNVIAPRYRTWVAYFFRTDFHRTNYSVHEPLNDAVRNFIELRKK